MRINLKLYQQGLILVGVPIGLMLFFLISLGFLLARAEQQTLESDRSKAIISTASSLLKEYFDAGSQLLFFQYSRSETSRWRFEHHLTSSKENFNALHELLKDDPQELAMLNELQLSGEKG